MSKLVITVTEYRDDNSRRTVWSSPPILAPGVDVEWEAINSRQAVKTKQRGPFPAQVTFIGNHDLKLEARSPTSAEIRDLIDHPLKPGDL